jgi:hypothetical protein
MTDSAEPENAQGPDAKAAAASCASVHQLFLARCAWASEEKGTRIREDLRGPFDLSDRF